MLQHHNSDRRKNKKTPVPKHPLLKPLGKWNLFPLKDQTSAISCHLLLLSFVFVSFVSQLLEHEAIYQWTDLTVMLCMLAVLSRKGCKSIVCLFSHKNTLFIFQITGKHPSAVLATGRKQHYLPRTQHERISHHQWKNPSSNPCWEERFVMPVSLALGGTDVDVIVSKMERQGQAVWGRESRQGGKTKREKWGFCLIGFERGQRAWSSLTGKS